MADLGGTFDPGAVSDDREVLPATQGVLGQVFESDLKATTKGTGQYLKLGVEIIDGVLRGRKLWANINVQNDNSQAQEIGQRELKRICEAAGVGPIRNSDELHFKPFLFDIIVTPAGVNKATGKAFDAGNEMKGFKFYGPTPAAPAAPGATAASPSAASASPSPATAAKPGLPWPSRA